jgi:hypothetical protein
VEGGASPALRAASRSGKITRNAGVVRRQGLTSCVL